MSNELIKLYAEYIEEIEKGYNANITLKDQKRSELLSKLTFENVNDIDEKNGWTLLHHAVFEEDIELVNACLEKGADVHKKNTMGDSPMYLALLKGKAEIIQKLKNKGGNVNETDSLGYTRLYNEVEPGNLRQVELLLNLGANVFAINVQTMRDNSILDAAKKLCKDDSKNHDVKLKIVKLLFENYIGVGANLDGFKLPMDYTKPLVLIDDHEQFEYEFMRTVTQGALLLGATLNGELVSEKTTGVEKAFFTISGTGLDLNKLQDGLVNYFNRSSVQRPSEDDQWLVQIYEDFIKESETRELKHQATRKKFEELYKSLKQRSAGITSLKALIEANLFLHRGTQQPNPKNVILPVEISEEIQKFATDIENELNSKPSSNPSK